MARKVKVYNSQDRLRLLTLVNTDKIKNLPVDSHNLSNFVKDMKKFKNLIVVNKTIKLKD